MVDAEILLLLPVCVVSVTYVLKPKEPLEVIRDFSKLLQAG